MRIVGWTLTAATLVFASSCGKNDADDAGDSSAEGSEASGSEASSSATQGTAEGSETSASTSEGTSGGPVFDVGADTETDGATTGPVDLCKVQGGGGNAPGPCRMSAPPDSFEPATQWEWAGMPGEPDSIVMPVVGNLTDDNDDGEIDLCDIPDILIVGSPDWYQHGHMVLLDGASGSVHFQFAELSQWAITPAIGDIDDDGISEIVGSVMGAGASLAAWEHDGTLKWQTFAIASEYAIALADLDNDGDVEIMYGNQVADHNGNLLWTAPDTVAGWGATTAADLDGDGDLEVVLGRSAYHHDGSQYFLNNSVVPSMPQVADLDQDGLPEILLLGGFAGGISMLEHDGTLKYQGLMPTGDSDWRRPAAVHDLDGDNVAEFAVSSGNNYAVYEGDGSIIWTAPVADLSGLASGTAFDFLGDGIAEAIYGDETNLFVFDGTGTPLLTTTRSSGTLIEYPVVVDVDNDGSSEIVVVSNEYPGKMTSPLLQVIKDIEDRWIQARRIWNQHTYHVTNVREDGTIPQFEPPHWEQLNTFRTNAQIEGGVVCDPEG